MIFRNKKIVVLIGIVVLAAVFLPVNFAQAGPDGSWWAGALSWVFISIAAALGKLLTIIMGAVSYFFIEFTDFDPDGKVTYGWTVVRDLCNMFFILVLLIIAFATILRIENYNVKKTLPKLLIMAVLINFSKTICFFLIDFSQVIMFTFANGFAGAPGNFVNALGLQHLNSISEKTTLSNISFDVLYAIIFTLIIVIITTIVMIMLLVILLMRMIMFWILTILSPIAFLAFAIPGAQKYTLQWWGEFTKYLIVGPVLAFFVWLALVISQAINDLIFTEDVDANNIEAMIATFSEPGHLYKYIIVIGLLIGALKITQQLGVMGGSIVMNMANSIKSRGLGLARKAALAPVKGAGKLGKNVGGWLVDKASSGLGIDLNVVRGYKRLTTQMDKNKKERELQIRGKTLETAAEKGGRLRSTLAHISTGDLAWKSATNFYKAGVVRRIFKGGKDVKRDYGALQEKREERKNVITKEEADKMGEEIEKKEERKVIVGKEIIAKEKEFASEKDKDKKKIIQDELDNYKIEQNTLGNEIPIMKEDLKDKIINPQRVKELKEDIDKLEGKVEKYEIKGMTEARAGAQAEMEMEQAKAVSHIDNSQELKKIFKEALKNRQQGLVAAVAKKMTRNYDYNELMEHMDLGTGRKGMQELADRLKTEGGFSEQAALGLVGEMGNIGKGIGHFGAFGAVDMQDGKWRKTSEDHYAMMQLAEMNKMQTQSFARNVNRLGVGYYINGEHTAENWRPSKSYIGYAKLNAKALAEIITKTGNQNAAEFLARYEPILRKNGAEAVADANKYRARSGEGADPLVVVKSIKGAKE